MRLSAAVWASLSAFIAALKKPAPAPAKPVEIDAQAAAAEMLKEQHRGRFEKPRIPKHIEHLKDWRTHTARLLQLAPDSIQVVRASAGSDGGIVFDEAPAESKVAIFDAGYSPGLLKDFGFAGSVSNAQLSWFASQSFIGWQICAILSQHWIISKACSMPARDAVRNGWKIKFSGERAGDALINDQITFYDRRLRIAHQCRELVRRMKIFGIRVAMPVIEYADPNAMEQPFNIDGVMPGSYKGWTQIDPYWVVPVLEAENTRPGSPSFYEPTWWVCNGRRIHKSHLIISRGPEVPDLLKPVYFFGGLPLTQLLYERVYAAEAMANEAPKLAQSKRTQVLSTNLSAAALNPQKIRQQLEESAEQANNYGTRVLGNQDKFEQFDTALADVDTVTMTEYQLVAAIAEIPATKLFGTQPKGFNSTGEHEADSYHEMLEGLQSIDMQPLIERHTLLTWQSHIRPLLKDNARCPDFTVEWGALKVMSEKEEAEVEALKINALKAAIDGGIIDPIDARDMLRSDEASWFHGIEAAVPSDAPPGAEEDAEPGAGGIQYNSKNEALAGLTGREMQALLRAVRKHNSGELSTAAAKVLLRPFGLPNAEIDLLLGGADVETGNASQTPAA